MIQVPLLDTSEEATKGLAKFNPLAKWTLVLVDTASHKTSGAVLVQ